MALQDQLASMGGSMSPTSTPNANSLLGAPGGSPVGQPASPIAGAPPASPTGAVPQPQQPPIDPRKLAMLQALAVHARLNTNGKVHGIRKEVWSSLDPQTQELIRKSPVQKQLLLEQWLNKSQSYRESLMQGKKFNPPRAKKITESFLEMLGLRSDVMEPGLGLETDITGNPIYPTGSMGAPTNPIGTAPGLPVGNVPMTSMSNNVL